MSSRKRPDGWRRRDFHRLAGSAAGAGALAALAPRFGGLAAADSSADTLTADATPKASQFGVNEAFRAAAFGDQSGAGWTRWTVQWFNLQPDQGDLNPHYFRDEQGNSILEAQVNRGMKVAAMVLGTPEWAAETPGLKVGTSVPRGLNTPTMVGTDPNPDNPWAVFMYKLAKQNIGLMEVFEIWNEVEIPTTGSNAVYNTWAGTPDQYYQLLKVASEAAKAANPNAKIATSPYSYFKDQQEGNGQALPWFDAFANAVKAGGADVFDIFAMNLYRNPHDLWDRYWGGVPILTQATDRVGFAQRLKDMGATGKQLWLTEINAMPYDDPVPGWDPAAKNDGFRITMEEQASYVLQAHALAAAAGWDKVFFQALQDDKYPVPDELWGLVRFNDDRNNADPSRARPAFAAYQMATQYLSDLNRMDFFIKVRQDSKIDKFRQYASRYKWGAEAVVAQKGDTRAYVMWNSSEAPQPVTIAPWGSDAHLLDRHGNELPLNRGAGNAYQVTLDPATRHFALFGGDPPNYFYVGGPTVVLVEKGVPPDAPISIDGFVKKERRQDLPTDPDAAD